MSAAGSVDAGATAAPAVYAVMDRRRTGERRLVAAVRDPQRARQIADALRDAGAIDVSIDLIGEASLQSA